jgi:hypothetical protein
MKTLNLFLKLFFLPLFFSSNVHFLLAQTDCEHPNGGDFCFEEVLNPCEQNGAFYWPFNDGCIPSWISANGNPDHRLASDFGPVGPEFGTFVASMQTTNNGFSNGCRNEALFLELDLAPNSNFTLTFSHRTKSNNQNWPSAPINVKVYQTFDMSVSNGWAGTAPCSNLSIPSGSQMIFEIDDFMASSFQQENISFTSINQPGWGLLFVPEINTQNNGQQWIIDLVCVKEAGLTAACDEAYGIQEFEWDNDDCPEMLCIREILDNGSLVTPTNPTLLVNWTSTGGPIAGITNGTCINQNANVFADHEGETISAFLTYNDGLCHDTLTFDIPNCTIPTCDENYIIEVTDWNQDSCPDMLCIREVLDNGDQVSLVGQIVQWTSTGGPIANTTNGGCLTEPNNTLTNHQGQTFTAIISYNNGLCVSP